MALIKCPECGKEISDKSNVCIHCGCPLEKPNTICRIDGQEYDFTAVQNLIDADMLDENVIENTVRSLTGRVNMGLFDCQYLTNIIIKSKTIPAEYVTAKAKKANQNIIRCPKCGSTSITTGARGANWTLGLFGASKTVNRCGACGYTWEPGR